MNHFPPELIAKMKAAKSAEELIQLTKEYNVELTEEATKSFFEQFHANGIASDESLESVAGGWGANMNSVSVGDRVKLLGKQCAKCGSTTGVILMFSAQNIGRALINCDKCGTLIGYAERSRYHKIS